MYDPQLKTFVEVAEQGSFSKAADALFLSPTAVMKQMNALESTLGVQLLRRTNHGVALTEAGAVFLKDARHMMRYADASVRRVREAQEPARRIIRVGTSALYPCTPLVTLWDRLSASHDRFRLKIVPFEGAMNTMLPDFGHKFDLVVGACGAPSIMEWCRFLELGQYRFCVAVPREHALAGRSLLALGDLHGEQLMLMEPGSSPANDRIRAEIERDHPAIDLVAAPHHYDVEVFNQCEEQGCALLTLDGWADVHPSLKTIPLDVPYTIPYGIIYPKDPADDVAEYLHIMHEALEGGTPMAAN